MTTNELKVAEKIRKLLNLARDAGATEAEAISAANMAQTLMAEHNITVAEIEARGERAGVEAERVKEGMKHRTVYKWQHSLMAAIGKVHFCTTRPRYDYRSNGQRVFDGYELIGRRANVAATQSMFDYLTGAVDRLARAAVNNDGTKVFTKFACSFREGCSDRLVERLKDRHAELVRQQDERAKAQSTGTSLVVLSQYVQTEIDLNNDLDMGWEPGETARRRAEGEARYQAWRADWESRREERQTQTAAPETDAERRKREKRDAIWRARWDAKARREQARLDWGGYSAGQQAGDDVGLDQQVNKPANHQRLA